MELEIPGSEITGLTGGSVRRHRSRVRRRASSDPRWPAPIGVLRSTTLHGAGGAIPVISGPKGEPRATPRDTKDRAISRRCVMSPRDVGPRTPNRRWFLKARRHISRFPRREWRLASRDVSFRPQGAAHWLGALDCLGQVCQLQRAEPMTSARSPIARNGPATPRRAWIQGY